MASSSDATPLSVDILQAVGDTLLLPDGKIEDASKLLDSKEVIGFYLGSLTPRCEDVNANVASIYSKIKTSTQCFEIVFVSFDKTEEGFQKHIKQMPWPSVPFNSPEKKNEKNKTKTARVGVQSPIGKFAESNDLAYEPGGRPRLLLFNEKGRLISGNGVGLLLAHGEELFKALKEGERASLEEKDSEDKKAFGFSVGNSWDRRMQSLSVFCFMIMIPMIVAMCSWALFLILNPFTTAPVITYLFWAWFVDDANITGLRNPWMRSLHWWTYFRDYFPIRLVKTADLDPKGKYIICYHPHGILSMGAWSCFATDACNFPEKFPGIDRRLLTLKLNFKIPGIREFLLNMGLCDASKESIQQILKKGPGSAVVLVTGGAQEALLTQPEHNEIYLEHRQGFVRQAIKAGADLVPTYGFGENDIYDTLYFDEDSWGYWLQFKAKKLFGFSTPIFHGRGLFFKRLPFLLPFRKPITVVVGKPIPVPKVSPDIDLRRSEEGKKIVNEVHAKYLDALRELWDDHKNLTVSGLRRSDSLHFRG